MRGRTGSTVVVLLSVVVVSPVHAAAGRTPGMFAVSNGGAATYTIPIFTPPRPRGIQPSIALVYNSNAPVGYVGKGWMVVGFSAILECNKTLAQDGVVGPGEDVTYCKDGNHLRLQSGSTGPLADGEWATEIADFSRIKSHWELRRAIRYRYVESR